MSIGEFKFVDKIINRSKSSYSLWPQHLYYFDDNCQTYQDFRVYHYDARLLAQAEKEIQGMDVAKALRLIFNIAAEGVDADDHSAKWLNFHAFMANIMRHPPVCQPMYPDKTMVTHPLVLLCLGEGRCGHVARLAVDFAIANGYEARLAQLAAHLVAEVKWDNEWRLVDVNKHFSLDHLKKVWPLPSAVTLSRQPYLLDSLPAMSDVTDNSVAIGAYGKSNQYWRTTKFHGEPKLSSIYFAKEIFENKFSDIRQISRTGIEYYTKNRSLEYWQHDRYYGWNDTQKITARCEMITLEYSRQKPRLVVPDIVYRSSSFIPVRICDGGFPSLVQPGLYSPPPVGAGYELKVSTETRGWNYDYPDYEKMPASGAGDVLTTSNLKIMDGMLGLNMPIPDKLNDLYIEARPLSAEDKTAKFPAGLSEFHWPSAEIQITIKDL